MSPIGDFYSQPAAGEAVSFGGKLPGTSYTGVVARTITHADVRQQADARRMPLYHPDGQPKFEMIVPLHMEPGAGFPDGRAAWHVRGAEREELSRAMAAAGLPPGSLPEQGALITITYAGDRPVPGRSPQQVRTITYQRGLSRSEKQSPASRVMGRW